MSDRLARRRAAPCCRGAADYSERHGPHYPWSYLKAEGVHYRTYSPHPDELMPLAIANQRRAKKLLRAWEVQSQRPVELNATT